MRSSSRPLTEQDGQARFDSSTETWPPDRLDLLAIYDGQLRRAEATNLAAGVRAERDGPLTRLTGQERGFISSPADLGLDGSALAALIARQRDFFAARGEAVEWKTRAHDLPPGLIPALLTAGFEAEESETVMIAPAALIARHHAQLPDGVSIRLTRDSRELSRLGALSETVHGQDFSAHRAALAAELATDPGRLTFALAEANAELVAAGRVRFEPGTAFAGLWGGSTLPAWRRRGIYRGLVAARARHALEHGYRYLQVDALATSRPVLERLGFIAVTETTPYVWTPPEPGR